MFSFCNKYFWFLCCSISVNLNGNHLAVSFQVTLHTDDMDLAGDIIQNMCMFLNKEDLQSTADFPQQMEHLKEVLVKVCPAHVL